MFGTFPLEGDESNIKVYSARCVIDNVAIIIKMVCKNYQHDGEAFVNCGSLNDRFHQQVKIIKLLKISYLLLK